MKKIRVNTFVRTETGPNSYLMEIEVEDPVDWVNNHLDGIADHPEGLVLVGTGNGTLFVRAKTIESVRVADVKEDEPELKKEEVKVGGTT